MTRHLFTIAAALDTSATPPENPLRLALFCTCLPAGEVGGPEGRHIGDLIGTMENGVIDEDELARIKRHHTAKEN